MTITKYRPQAPFVTSFDQLVNEFFGNSIGQFAGSDDMKRSMPSVNIIERDKEYSLHLLAPGFSKADLKISMEENLLTISAEKKTEDLKETERYTRREFSSTSFSRSFRVPEGLNTASVKAEFVDGVLQITIPKVEVQKPSVKEISIS